jgi:hypothetical protein
MATDCSRSSIRRGIDQGKGEQGFRVQTDGYLGEGPRRRKAVETPTKRKVIDAGDLACGRVMEELRHNLDLGFTTQVKL